MNIYRPISEIMTTELKTVDPLNVMTEIAEIFDKNSIHHIPVVSDEGRAVGMISRHDYHQFQHHFTKYGWEMAEASNNKLFRTLTAKDVMTSSPLQMDKEEPIRKAIVFFLTNRVHSIIITDESLCVGIVTPYDILDEIKTLSTVLQ